MQTDWRSGSHRIDANGADADACRGAVRWSPAKSLWMTSMTGVALIAAPQTFSAEALAVFLATTAVTLCAGHSVGMHRKLIHGSFECPKVLEYVLVYLGVLVGMSCPFGIIRQHDMRDWAQRRKACHPFLRHGRDLLTDYFWQVHGELDLAAPPRLALEPAVARDPVYILLERTWMLQQAPIALLLFQLGGWSFVVWGVCARVAVSVTGHPLVGYYAHHEREGDDSMSWRVRGAGVQGRDVALAGVIGMGESWHNNHHAFPGSAKLGLFRGQTDLGWALIVALRHLGLAWNIVTPERLPARPQLVRLRAKSPAPLISGGAHDGAQISF